MMQVSEKSEEVIKMKSLNIDKSPRHNPHGKFGEEYNHIYNFKEDSTITEESESISDLNLIRKMKSVPKCTILQSGLRATRVEMKFFYCSCDPDKINHICEECAIKCHAAAGHEISEQPPAFFKCSCGERVHNVTGRDPNKSNIYQTKCFYSELSVAGGLNFYYKNLKGEDICIFCKNLCSEEEINRAQNNSINNKTIKISAKSTSSYTNNNYQKITVESESLLPSCQCSHPNHHNLKALLKKKNLIAYKNNNFFWGVKGFQLFNLFINCKESYQNVYSDLHNTFTKNELMENTNKVLLDKKIHLTNFFFALKSLANLSKMTDGLFYYSQDLINLTPFSFNFVQAVSYIDFEDSLSLWTVLKYIFLGFKNITIGHFFRALPKFKLNDLEEMSALQRLVLTDKRKENYQEFNKLFINGKVNITSLLISVISKIFTTKFVQIKVLDVLTEIVSILKILAYRYLITSEQMVLFLGEFDKLFHNFIKIKNKPKYHDSREKINSKLAKLFSKVIKILQIFIYNHNDGVVNKLINTNGDVIANSENSSQSFKFLHENMELGRSLFRVNMKVVHLISNEYKEENMKQFPIFNKILRHGVKIINMFGNILDPYALSLKKNLNSNNVFINILTEGIYNSNNVNESEGKNNILEFLNKESKEIEKLYGHFSNFQDEKISSAVQKDLIVNKWSLITKIENSIDNFFKLVKISNHDLTKYNNAIETPYNKSSNFSMMNEEGDKVIKNKFKNKLLLNESNIEKGELNFNQSAKMESKIKEGKENESIKKHSHNKIKNESQLIKSCFYRSDYLFTIVKLFKLVDMGDTDSDKTIIRKIYFLIWFFLDNDADNAVIILSQKIFDYLNCINYAFAFKNFELYHHCIKLLSSREEVGCTKSLLKRISNYLDKIPSQCNEKYICLEYFLKIMNSILHETKSLHFHSTVLKTKKIINNLFSNFPFFKDFVKFLMEVTQDVLYGKYQDLKIEDYDESKGNQDKLIFRLPPNENFLMFNSLAFNIFYLTLKITNKIFDSSDSQDRNFLKNLFPKENLNFILQYKMLNLNIRTEIIVLYRKAFLDIIISEKESDTEKYIKIFTKGMFDSSVKHRALNHFPAELYSFFEDLIKISDGQNTQNNFNNLDKDFTLGNKSSLIQLNSSKNNFNSRYNSSKFDLEAHNFILNELNNYKEIIEFHKTFSPDKTAAIFNYFERGLVMPISLYFRKMFAVVNNLTGKDFLEVWSIFPAVLNMKKYFIESNREAKFFLNQKNLDFENYLNHSQNKKENEKIIEIIFTELKGFNKMSSHLATSIIESIKPMEILRDLDKLKSKSFPAFDYTSIHSIIDSQHFTMMQKPPSSSISDNFKRLNEDSLEENFLNLLESVSDNKRLFEIAFLYQRRKGNLESEVSALGQGLEETASEFEKTNRHLLTEFLIFILNKADCSDYFSIDANFILFKLLQYHTGDIQKDLKEILEAEAETNEGEEKNNNYKQKVSMHSNRSLKSVKSVMSNQSNKKEKEINHPFNLSKKSKNSKMSFKAATNQLKNQEIIQNIPNDENVSLDLIKNPQSRPVHKLAYLNNFAETLFNKLLKIFVSDFNPRDFIYNPDYLEAYNIIKVFKFMCEEHNNFFQGNLVKRICFSFRKGEVNNNKEKLNLFDLLLLVLNNILLWTDWGKNEHHEDYNIDYFFDLFCAIIELLIEIIQGNTVENLSYITVNKISEENISSGAFDNSGNKMNKSAFQIFLESIISRLLFHDGNSSSTLFALRTQLMNFLCAILEEKNCSQDLKAYIIDSLSINKILQSIINTLKIYFLQHTKNDKNWNGLKEKYFVKRFELGTSTNKFDNGTINNFNGFISNNNLSMNGNLFQSNLNLGHQMTNSSSEKYYKLLKFDFQMYNYFSDQYFTLCEGFPESCEFEFTNALYKYIKLISIPPYKNEASDSLISSALNIPQEEIIAEMNLYTDSLKTSSNHKSGKSTNLIKNNIPHNKFTLVNQKGKSYEISFCEHYFIIKFFESITQMVEVLTESKQKETVIFTVMPSINLLSNASRVEFLQNVNRENKYTKLYDLIRNVDYFKKEIEYNSSHSSNKIFTFFKDLNYNFIGLMLFLFALAINVIIFAVVTGDTRKIYNYDQAGPPRPPPEANLTIYEHETTEPAILYDRYNIRNMIQESLKQWDGVYFPMALVFIGLCVFFIISYIIAKVPLYYEIELIKYQEQSKVKRKHITLKEKIKIIIYDVIFGRDYISTLLFMTICATLAVSFETGYLEMFYSFILLSIININPTLKNITVAIKLKYKEILSTLLLTFIMIYSYSSIGFYFFKQRFEYHLEEQSDNYCSSLFFCFLSHSNGGFRIEGGIGDFLEQKYSFEKAPGLFAGRLFYDFVSFCIINILMRELVFGIMIETFKDLRMEEQKFEWDKKNKCFICGVTKDELEKDRGDFTQHCEKEHNIWSYINYMIRLKFSDPQDLNAINSFTREQIDKKYTKWIPSYDSTKEVVNVEEMEDEDFNADIEKHNEIHNSLLVNKN